MGTSATFRQVFHICIHNCHSNYKCHIYSDQTMLHFFNKSLLDSTMYDPERNQWFADSYLVLSASVLIAKPLY